jgi:pimeloyl-ACP methyl ester carboxylesterase
MQPFYFGTSQEQLFGAYHAPEGRAARTGAVVLCHPLGHEYLRAHRAFRNLAAALAGQGFHVLRFDYFGSGDSGGDADQTTIDRCLADLSTAIQELKDISGASRVSLIGLRMGATLAALAATGRRDIDRLILWDPVPDGRTYVEELRSLQRSWLQDRLGTTDAAGPSELIGFELAEALRAQLEATTLNALPRMKAKSVSLMISGDAAPYQTLLGELQREQPGVVCTVVDESNEWQRGDLVHQILLPHAMVRTIASAMIS